MDPGIFAFDPYVIAFVKNNAITLGILYVILKEVFKATPWQWDDNVLQVLVEKIKEKINPHA